MIPKFLDELLVWHVGPGLWKLQIELRYQSHNDGVFTVPAGFVTDLASIPKIFRMFLSPAGSYARATVLHDWFYKSHDVSREKADELLFEACRSLGVSKIVSKILFKSVKVFGEKYYNKGGSIESASSLGG